MIDSLPQEAPQAVPSMSGVEIENLLARPILSVQVGDGLVFSGTAMWLLPPVTSRQFLTVLPFALNTRRQGSGK